MTLTVETPDIESSLPEYAARFRGDVGQYFLDVQFSIVSNLLKQRSHPRILDVGGGHGQLAIPLIRMGYDVTVVGSAPACRERIDSALPAGAYQFVASNLLALPFEDNAFDVTLAFRIVSHLKNWRELIAELCRVSSQAVILDYPDLRSFNVISNRLFAAKKAIEGNTRPFRCFRRRDLSCAFASSGFGIQQFVPQFYLPMVLHRRLRAATVSRTLERIAGLAGFTRIFGSPVIVQAEPVSKTAVGSFHPLRTPASRRTPLDGYC